MRQPSYFVRALAWLVVILLTVPPELLAQEAQTAPVFKQEELDQLVAPIALHPDALISQILMAATYPLEVVQAERWAKQNAKLKGDQLTAALEKQDWDPSVKSLVNFPQVLTMMSEKLDWTQRLGDAFIEDQKKVLDSIQGLRAKAQAAGNLQSTKEQSVIVEEKIIKIESTSPQTVYVPTYNPTVVYGAWPYPASPPYAYYPPGYVASSMLWFGAGVAAGAAWGYAWGNCNWGGGDVDINTNRNTNINTNIDRSKYQGGDRGQGGSKGQGGRFQHNPEHRKGVSYRDQGTAQKFNRAGTNDAVKSRDQFRGRAEQGRQDIGRGDVGGRGGQGGAGDRGGASQLGGGGRGGAGDRGGASQLGGGGRGGSGGGGGAFSGVDRGGSSARSASQRGSSSRASSGGSRGGGGGGSRGGGGGGRGGGGGGGRRR
jgi:hypothetical protein